MLLEGGICFGMKKKKKDIQVLGRFVGNLLGPGGVQLQIVARVLPPSARQLTALCCQWERVAAICFIFLSHSVPLDRAIWF